MIQITPHMRILVAVEPIDFRAGIDGLVNNCRKLLQADPFSGALFVFGNRARTALKVLVYDGQGFWMCHKRLSTGKFTWWPAGHEQGHTLQACELQVLLMAGNPTQAHAAPAWRALQASRPERQLTTRLTDQRRAARGSSTAASAPARRSPAERAAEAR